MHVLPGETGHGLPAVPAPPAGQAEPDRQQRRRPEGGDHQAQAGGRARLGAVQQEGRAPGPEERESPGGEEEAAGGKAGARTSDAAEGRNKVPPGAAKEEGAGAAEPLGKLLQSQTNPDW